MNTCMGKSGQILFTVKKKTVLIFEPAVKISRSKLKS